MHLLIDANNLAGALGLLGQSNFDEKLILILAEYNAGRGNYITLVFDGVDLMGDRYSKNNLTVVYTPRDSYYESADDKIIELAEEHFKISKDELKVITDDIDLKNILSKKNFKEGVKFRLVQATDFAEILMSKKTNEIACDDRNLSEEEMDNINKDLLKIWK
jgi:predicted RNA-binding protein with PIN domain